MTKPWREGKRKKPDLIAEREAAHLPKRSAPEPRFVVLIYLWSNPGEMYVGNGYKLPEVEESSPTIPVECN